MPARTRASKHDASSKVYSSKKVAKQRHFPERRKIVRRRSSRARENQECQQTTLARQRHGAAGTVLDSEEDEDNEDEETLQHVGQRRSRLEEPRPSSETGSRRRHTGPRSQVPTRKRSLVKEESADEDEEPIRPTPKRRRIIPKIKRERSASVGNMPLMDVEDEEDSKTSQLASGIEGEEEVDSVRRRRQTTMTQIVDGRRPRHGYQEPEFKPVKRASRKSWNGQSVEKDAHQRTLTQMVPGLLPLGIMSDEDEEEDEEYLESEPGSDSQAYNNAIVAHLSRQGVFSPDCKARRRPQTKVLAKEEVDDDERSIPAQRGQNRLLEMGSTSRSSLGGEKNQAASDSRKPAITTSKRARFGLLSTPEKRQVREIASSQSPAESMLSTQSSPSKLKRSPLKERSQNRVQDTPSRKKQVAFQEPTLGPVPPLLRTKFKGVVQDSDEEDASWSEGDEHLNEHSDVDEGASPLLHGASIGKDTQAMLEQIDRACAYAGEIVVPTNREVSQELGEPFDHETPTTSDEHSAHTPSKALDVDPSLVPAEPTWRDLIPRHNQQDLSLVKAEELSSSPIVIKDEPSDDEHNPTPPQLSSCSLHPTPHEPSQTAAEGMDLDGELIETAHSPSQRRPETQQSHCSKAEQQLHSESVSYTQYRHQPQSSSMHVAHDAFSYQATPFPAKAFRPGNPPQVTMGASQATTIDGTQMTPKKTPRKAATQPPISANTTPHRARDGSVIVSPQRPPSLFIPSSFPTPGRTRGEIWSSPTFDRHISGNGASIEDFSIPPLPPLDDDIEDDF